MEWFEGKHDQSQPYTAIQKYSGEAYGRTRFEKTGGNHNGTVSNAERDGREEANPPRLGRRGWGLEGLEKTLRDNAHGEEPFGNHKEPVCLQPN